MSIEQLAKQFSEIECEVATRDGVSRKGRERCGDFPYSYCF